MGADCAEQHTVARLLLRHALEANPHGVVLYSTGKPSRLQGLDALVSAASTPDPALAAFELLAREELSPPARSS